MLDDTIPDDTGSVTTPTLPTLLLNHAKPVELIVIAAPVPSPTPLTAPVKVVVPAPVPDAIVRS